MPLRAHLLLCLGPRLIVLFASLFSFAQLYKDIKRFCRELAEFLGIPVGYFGPGSCEPASSVLKRSYDLIQTYLRRDWVSERLVSDGGHFFPVPSVLIPTKAWTRRGQLRELARWRFGREVLNGFQLSFSTIGKFATVWFF